MIFTKNTRTTETGQKEYEIRTMGMNYWISRPEFEHQVLAGNMNYKANYPVTDKDLVKL